jgi:hypothetical protein
MARHRSFSSEFKRRIAQEFLEGQAGMHELARRHSLSRNLIRLWILSELAFCSVLVSDPSLGVNPTRRMGKAAASRR